MINVRHHIHLCSFNNKHIMRSIDDNDNNTRSVMVFPDRFHIDVILYKDETKTFSNNELIAMADPKFQTLFQTSWSIIKQQTCNTVYVSGICYEITEVK